MSGGAHGPLRPPRARSSRSPATSWSACPGRRESASTPGGQRDLAAGAGLLPLIVGRAPAVRIETRLGADCAAALRALLPQVEIVGGRPRHLLAGDPALLPVRLSELIYGAGARNSVYGLEGVDFQTGEPKLFVPTTPSPTENSFFAATTVGPEGDTWIGGIYGISVFRGPDRPDPAFGCKDLEPPLSGVRRTRRPKARRTTVHGHARDRACGRRRTKTIARVDVAVARKVRGGCRHLRGRRLARSVQPCSLRRFQRAKLGHSRAGQRAWTLRRRVRLPTGRYLVVSRARDRAGNLERRQDQRGTRLGVKSRPRAGR